MKFKMIDNHTLTEMARVGSFNDCEVMVYGGEGPIPHFHIYNKQTGQKCCIRIDCAEYFNHNSTYKMELSNSDKKDLIEWLSSYYPRLAKFEITIFQYIVNLWSDNNPDYELDANIEMPNYMNLR